MVLMAIDHVRVYSGVPAGGPTPGAAAASPSPATPHNVTTTGLRHLGKVTGAGSLLITFAVKPASSI